MGLISGMFFFIIYLQEQTKTGSKCNETMHLLPKIIILKQEMWLIFFAYLNWGVCLRGGLSPFPQVKRLAWLPLKLTQLTFSICGAAHCTHCGTMEENYISYCTVSISKG